MFTRSDLQGHHSFVNVPHCYFWLCASPVPFFQTACFGFDVMHGTSEVDNSFKANMNSCLHGYCLTSVYMATNKCSTFVLILLVFLRSHVILDLFP